MEMAQDYQQFDDRVPPARIGEQLRAAREAAGLTLEEVAAATRIPQRHLVTIEAGDFQALPARTYAVGFSRTYAKAVGLHDGDVAEAVRAELEAQEPRQRHRPASFEPGDPARVPSRALGWLSVLAVVLVLAGLFFAARTYFAPAAELPSLVEQQRAEEQAQRAAAAAQAAPRADPARAAAAAAGPVVFTAIEDAWVRFYTPQGTLIEKVMTAGETYQVPVDAQQPMLRTGRPDLLQITVAGRPVPKLAEELQTMSDVPVTAAALLNRAGAAAAAAATPAPAGAASPTT
jgi:cytoskeletal protein RodZ